MSDVMERRHIRIVAALIMCIGLLLFTSMVVIALGNSAALNGVVFQMFIVGIVAGAIIIGVGAILFQYPHLGRRGST